MKLLLDENLPHQVRLEIPGHEVATTACMGWSGIENGELLLLLRAAQAGFDALITNDRGLEHEQNIEVLPIAVIVLLAKSNTVEAIRPLYSELMVALAKLQPREFVKLTAT